jgi:redox-sensitive bicupin YhaK (pirin superfamily)
VTAVIDVRRGADRFTTEGDGILTRHSFSFGAHYDPDDVGFSVLRAHNDDRLAPGAGYAPHLHSDLEIVTWVLEGGLTHSDSHGHDGLVTPGVVQRLGAGSGVRHSERNTGAATTRFVQMWLRPDQAGVDPTYDRADVTSALASGALVPVVSGDPGVEAPLRLRTAGAVLWAARLDGEDALPDARRAHLFVARGSVEVDAIGPLEEGDAVRVDGEALRSVRGTGELLVWQLP